LLCFKNRPGGQITSEEVVHGHYKDLALVEEAFRTSKTAQLEIRPFHGRLVPRIRGYGFALMLACRTARNLSLR